MDRTQILRAIGTNIRHARLQADLTQEGLAEAINIHWKTLGYIESGKRDFGTSILARIVSVLPELRTKAFLGITLATGQNSRLIQKATKRKRKPQKGR